MNAVGIFGRAALLSTVFLLGGCSGAMPLWIDHGPVAHVKMGLELERKGRKAEAAGHYQAALRAENNYIPALIALGNQALEDGAPAKARRYYRRALLADPDHAGANNNLAMTFLAEGRLSEAEALAKKALLNAGPLGPYVRDTLAQIREAKGGTWHKRSGKEQSVLDSSASQ